MLVDPKVILFLQMQADKYPDIKRLLLFGSRSRGDANERSDYDIAVFESIGQKSTLFYLDVKDNIPTLCGVDLVPFKENLNKKFKERILKEGKQIYPK